VLPDSMDPMEHPGLMVMMVWLVPREQWASQASKEREGHAVSPDNQAGTGYQELMGP